MTPKFVEIAAQRLGNRAEVKRADISDPLDLPNESFDLVLCSLVLDYVQDLKTTFCEFHRILNHSGILVFSMGHPTNDCRLFPDRDYFSTELKEWTWKGFGEPKPIVKWYCRPLNMILNPLLEAGFRLNKFLETQPTKEYQEADPETYSKLMRRPTFICIRAVKE